MTLPDSPYFLPMGMGIMRVGVMVLEVIRYRTHILATCPPPPIIDTYRLIENSLCYNKPNIGEI